MVEGVSRLVDVSGKFLLERLRLQVDLNGQTQLFDTRPAEPTKSKTTLQYGRRGKLVRTRKKWKPCDMHDDAFVCFSLVSLCRTS